MVKNRTQNQSSTVLTFTLTVYMKYIFSVEVQNKWTSSHIELVCGAKKVWEP